MLELLLNRIYPVNHLDFSKKKEFQINNSVRQALATLAAFADDILEAAAAGRNVEMAQQNLRQLGAILGLRLDAEGPEKRVSRGWQQHKQRFLEE